MLLTYFQSHPLILVYFLIAIVLAITVHEFSHAWIATRLGDPTAKMAGRVTFNPLAHIDPIGLFALIIAGFGWGKPVPYNPYYVRGGRWGELWIALAGPFSNLVIAFLFALPYRIGLLQGANLIDNPWLIFTSAVVEINIWLAAFNLLPIPPLDGSKLLYLALDKITGGNFDHTSLEQSGPIILLAIIFLQSILKINLISYLLTPIVAIFNLIVGGISLPTLF